MNPPKSDLRQYYRAQRRVLSPHQKTEFSQLAAHILSEQSEFKSASRIALYMATAEEMPTTDIFLLAHAAHKMCAVPILSEDNTLMFVSVDKNTLWKANRYGILEPDFSPHETSQLHKEIIPPEAFDIVLVPLVSFDATGSRLGMGAGYYDKTFAFRQHVTKPLLIGLGFECQRHEKLPTASHDVRLDAVITEKAYYRFSPTTL